MSLGILRLDSEEKSFSNKLWNLLDTAPYYFFTVREKRLIIAALLEGDLPDYALTSLELAELDMLKEEGKSHE